jgi:hypothetical protein
MPHLVKTTALKTELLRSGAYETLGKPSRIVNGRVYLQLADGGSLYVGPGAFHNAAAGVVLLTHEAPDCGHFCLLENLGAEAAAAVIQEFLTAHGMDEAALRAAAVAVPPGWTADP